MASSDGLDLNGLPIFVALVEAGSFTAAAERLGCTKTRVSLQIRQLEERLGVALFHRTTRRVNMTQSGEAFYRECRPLLNGLSEAVSAVESHRHVLKGDLRITAPEGYAAQVIGSAVVKFSAEHPELAIELRSDDRVSDMVEEGIDLAIRVGWLRDSSLRSSRLGSFRQYVVSSPAYLESHGVPQQPEDLAHLDWVAFTRLPSPLTWTFRKEQEERKVQMHARLKANSAGALCTLLAAGAGVSVLGDIPADAEIRAGRLVRILEDWSLPEGGVHAVYPPGRHVPVKVRTFVDFLHDYLGKQ